MHLTRWLSKTQSQRSTGPWCASDCDAKSSDYHIIILYYIIILMRLPGNVQLVQRRSDRLGSQRHRPSDVQQWISDDHVPGGDVCGSGPLGYAFPTDQSTAVTAVSPTQHGHRVQPVLLTVSTTTAATGHRVPDFVVVIILRLHPVKRKSNN